MLFYSLVSLFILGVLMAGNSHASLCHNIIGVIIASIGSTCFLFPKTSIIRWLKMYK